MYDQRSPNEIHLQHQWKWEKNLQNIIYECNLRNSKQRMNWLIKKLTKNFKRKDFDEKENEAVQKTTQVWVLNTKLKKALPQEAWEKLLLKSSRDGKTCHLVENLKIEHQKLREEPWKLKNKLWW